MTKTFQFQNINFNFIFTDQNRKMFIQILKRLRSQLSEYARNGSLHGLKYTVDQSRSLWERIVWVLIMITSAVIAVGIILLNFDKFQNAPTITGS